MKPPIDHVRVSAQGREILIKLKRRTGLEHWNELCRVALCRSLANPKPPTIPYRIAENAIDMEWKTFAGAYSSEFSSAILIKARADGVNLASKEALGEYLRAHIERGIASLQNVKTLGDLVKQM
ncbi:MAG: DNA sulfur modification protein DndE [Betaproteobacteria bacterium]|nr:DNA sulfur modification protein DndE [Betaproteobacteria bacterium]